MNTVVLRRGNMSPTIGRNELKFRKAPLKLGHVLPAQPVT
ncbi:hypothetical protein KIPE111705_39705 [Kibdelosporangium persicum]